MDLLTIVLVGITAFTFLHFLLKDSKVQQTCDAPGPWTLPFIGCFLVTEMPLWRWMERVGKKFGNIVQVQMPDQLYVIVNGYKEVRLVYENDDLLGRPDFPGRKEIFGENGGGLSLSEGKIWMNHRRFSIRALKDLGFGRQSCETDIEIEADMIIDNIRENSEVSSEGIDPSDVIYEGVCNVISKIIFGRRAASEDSIFKSKLETIQYLTQENQMRLPFMLISKLLKTFPTLLQQIPDSIKNLIQGPFQEILVFIQEQIDARRTMLENSANNINTDLIRDKQYENYVDMYLTEKKDYFSDSDELNETANPTSGVLPLLKDGRLVMTIFDLITGGTDTIANALRWGLLFAAQEPEMQLKLQQEIDTAVENNISFSMSQREHFVYSEAFIEEVHRSVTLLPLGVIRRALKTTVIEGFVIPRNTWVVANLHGLHHDPEIFPDPYTFNPDRHISTEGTFQPLRELMSFSMGKRGCPGEHLARMELLIIFTKLLREFTVGIPPQEEVHLPTVMRGSDGIVRAPLKHKLLFHQRANHTNSSTC